MFFLFENHKKTVHCRRILFSVILYLNSLNCVLHIFYENLSCKSSVNHITYHRLKIYKIETKLFFYIHIIRIV